MFWPIVVKHLQDARKARGARRRKESVTDRWIKFQLVRKILEIAKGDASATRRLLMLQQGHLKLVGRKGNARKGAECA